MLALLARRRAREVDRTERAAAATIKLPDERHGLLFVFRVFDRVSYALILQVTQPVTRRRPLHPALTPRRSAAALMRPRRTRRLAAAAATPGVGRDTARAGCWRPSARRKRYSQPHRRAPRASASGAASALALRRALPSCSMRGHAGLAGQRRRRGMSLHARRPGLPAALLETADPPLLLYAQGRLELLGDRRVAIVGSRNPTPQGVDNARAFAAT